MKGLITEEDTLELHSLIESLQVRRVGNNRSQFSIANQMRVSEHEVSELEQGISNPRISLLQGYARALGGYIEIQFVHTTIT